MNETGIAGKPEEKKREFIARYDTYEAWEEETNYFMTDDIEASIEALDEECVEFLDPDGRKIFLGKLLNECDGDPGMFHFRLKELGVDIEDDVQRVRSFDHAYDSEWESCKDCIQEWINNNEGPYVVIGRRMGWRSLTGWTVVTDDDGEEFFRKINPNTGDLTFNMWKEEGDSCTARAIVSHHDAPTGESREIWTLRDLVNNTPYKKLRGIVAKWKDDLEYYDLKPKSWKRTDVVDFFVEELYPQFEDNVIEHLVNV